MGLIRTSKRKIGGIVVPLVTPLRAGGELDRGSLNRMVEHVAGAGVNGLFMLGSTGEASSLSVEVRCSLLREVAQSARERVPLIVNVSDTAFDHTLRVADEAAQSGAFAVALSPPSYFVLDQHQLSAYSRHFCERSPLPVFLYNVPQFAHTAFEPETVCELAELPNVIGLKNSDGSLEYLQRVQSLLGSREGFSVLVGNEETLLPALELGADGGVCGGANMFPELFVELFQAATEGRGNDAERLQQIVGEVSEAVYGVGAPETSYLRGLKRALSALGLIEDALAEPLQNFEPAEKAELDGRFARVLAKVRQVAESDHSVST
ncbi:MAG TPA: dihydrodipicolinate synthase family protein [Bryobacteraceae bacterium]|nr:dihydrodipicolinate synthase family protein [Bryobacteraceae bacterium]